MLRLTNYGKCTKYQQPCCCWLVKRMAMFPTDSKFRKIYVAILIHGPSSQVYFRYLLYNYLTIKRQKRFTMEALHGCLAKSMVLLEALNCFSRSRRFSAFFLAPVFFLGIVSPLSAEKNREIGNCLPVAILLNKLSDREWNVLMLLKSDHTFWQPSAFQLLWNLRKHYSRLK